MTIRFTTATGNPPTGDLIYLAAKNISLGGVLSADEAVFVEKKREKKTGHASINRYGQHVFVVFEDDSSKGPTAKNTKEKMRAAGAAVSKEALKNGAVSVFVNVLGKLESDGSAKAFVEGFALALYKFEKHKSEKKESPEAFEICFPELSEFDAQELSVLTEAVFATRDLVNEPHSHQTAANFGASVETLGLAAGFSTEVFGMDKIKSLKMGGLLGVNQGSVSPPAFIIMEYKHDSLKDDEKPFILVGKGVVYDTGGLSLKDTAMSMDFMKCDMAGGAAVAGALFAAAKMKLPIRLVGLVPATDNRPGFNALAPGDVLTMYSGLTVEVMNTDAEGRLILGDALAYAAKYDPKLVIDLATLTGSAAAAIGREGTVYMSACDEKFNAALETSGKETYEKLVRFPLWDEYSEYLVSDIADIKNIGGPAAGAIVAGKFLQRFVSYDWMHLDIAGPSFLHTEDSYRGKGASGVGVRLLYDFLKGQANK